MSQQVTSPTYSSMNLHDPEFGLMSTWVCSGFSHSVLFPLTKNMPVNELAGPSGPWVCKSL